MTRKEYKDRHCTGCEHHGYCSFIRRGVQCESLDLIDATWGECAAHASMLYRRTVFGSGIKKGESVYLDTREQMFYESVNGEGES